MANYFVDFENVHDDGLIGIKDLSAQDKVVVFYGTQIKSISFDRHMDIVASKAMVEYIKTARIAKNYLDFQLATQLGFFIGKGEKGPFHIISKDTGYDSVVDFWRGRNIDISRSERIQKKSEGKSASTLKKKKVIAPKTQKKANELSEAYRKKIRAAVKADKIQSSNYTSIYKAIVNCKEKQEFNTSMVKSFGQEKGNVIYGKLKDILVEYHSSNK